MRQKEDEPSCGPARSSRSPERLTKLRGVLGPPPPNPLTSGPLGCVRPLERLGVRGHVKNKLKADVYGEKEN